LLAPPTSANRPPFIKFTSPSLEKISATIPDSVEVMGVDDKDINKETLKSIPGSIVMMSMDQDSDGYISSESTGQEGSSSVDQGQDDGKITKKNYTKGSDANHQG
jgi:hypothetical protein